MLTTYIGDHLLNLIPVHPIPAEGQKAENWMDSAKYHLIFTDTPTGKTYTKKVDGENDAYMLVAAWLASDEEGNLGPLEKYRKELQDDPNMEPFLP